jgi:hypothetical protein
MYVWEMVRQAVNDLGGETTNVAVRDWILQRYPGTNPNTIQCQIIVCTVNHPSRVHYPENTKPRAANTKYDFLYRCGRGLLELYNPEKHGQWEIYEQENGKLGVRRIDEEVQMEEEEAKEGTGFAAEDHLRDYLAQHLDVIEPGLELYVDDHEKDGVEYRTGVGNIDILAVDKKGGFVVIELKVSRGPDAASGQILRYKNWVKVNLANNRPIRGIIIARHISQKIRYAIASDPEVTAKEYDITLSLRDVEGIRE